MGNTGELTHLSPIILSALPSETHLHGVGPTFEIRYIISVITITSIGEGKILPSTGQARFKTTYTAVVMKPFKGEVVDGKVVNVNKVKRL